MELRISTAFLLLSSCLSTSWTQNVNTNTIEDDPNPFAEAAQAFLGDKSPDLTGIVSNLLQSEEGKQLGGMLMGAAMGNSDGAGQLLSGLGSMLGGKEAGSLDPGLLGNLVGMLAENTKKDGKSGDDKIDIANLMGMAGSFIQNSGMNMENTVDLLPQMMQTLNSFVGPEAKQRELEHQKHAWLLPPVFERIHILFDHFAHSELGRTLWKKLGLEKLFNTFSRDGKFDFNKFFTLLENQSFRRHWIHLITQKITNIMAVVSDPRTHKMYLNTGVSVVNGFLKSFGFPKSSLIDLSKPTETITGATNYFFNRFLNVKMNAKQYVQPAVKYAQEVITLAQERGILLKEGLDSRALSNKLTDTINLEIIEPLARVYRAYRFAKRTPECDKYVMCLINQEDPNEVLSLPGLKIGLSKTASVFVSWFLSAETGTSFWSLYSNSMDEKDCSIRFVDKCNDFHIEEIKVTTEYVHNEL